MNVDDVEFIFLMGLLSILVIIVFSFFCYYKVLETDYFDYRNKVKIPDMQKFVSEIFSPDKQRDLVRKVENFIENPQFYSRLDKIKKISKIFNSNFEKIDYNVFKFNKLNKKICREIRITKSKVKMIESFENRVTNFIGRNSELDPKYLTSEGFKDLKKYLSDVRHALQAYLNKLQELLSHLNGIHYRNMAKIISVDIKNYKKSS